MTITRPGDRIHGEGVALPAQRDDISTLAAALLEARRRAVASALPPGGVELSSVADAYEVQARVARTLGPVKGWKVGADTPVSEPAAAPIHAGSIFADGATLDRATCRFWGMEAEIGYRFARDIGPRDDDIPWTMQQVSGAIASVHPVIEVIDTRFAAPGTQHPLLHLADHQSHGVLVVGKGTECWQSFDPASEEVTLEIDGESVVRREGGNNGGDPLRLLTWLVNHVCARGGGVEAGTIVITGSRTGTVFLEKPARITARFASLGTASMILT